MTYDISSVDSEKASDITQNAYYKKLQKDLKERTSVHDSKEHPKDNEHSTVNDNPNKIQEVAKSMAIEDKVDLKSIQWGSGKNKDTLQATRQATPVLSSIDLKHDGSAILRILGKKIDLTSQANQLRQQYMSSIVQGKSHNFFFSKFGQFKIGVFGQLLTALGSSPSELELLRRKAIGNAVEENKNLMADNIYNIELNDLLYGKSKKNRRLMAKLLEIQRQLITQMNNYTEANYWNPITLTEEQLSQCKKIQEEFSQERSALKYQVDFYRQSI